MHYPPRARRHSVVSLVNRGGAEIAGVNTIKRLSAWRFLQAATRSRVTALHAESVRHGSVQQMFLHFPHGVARQAVDKVERARHLE